MCKDCGCGEGHKHIAVVQVDGMTCNHCKTSVEERVLSLPGILSVEVDLEAKTVTMSLNPNAVSEKEIREAIEDLGFDVQDISMDEGHHHGVFYKIFKLFK